MGEKDLRRPPQGWLPIVLAAGAAFMLGALLRPHLGQRLDAVASAASMEVAPAFTRLAEYAMQPDATRPAAAQVLMKPLLTARELLTLQHYARVAERYLEWGSGASTFIVAPMARRAWSIENNQPWCAMMQQEKIAFKFWQAQGVLHYNCIDTGPTKNWGFPGPGVTVEQTKLYVDAVDTLGQPQFDAVLIDGRFRVACGLKVLPYLTDNSVVLVHDWEQRREHYGPPLLQFYEMVELVDKLAVLRRLPNWNKKVAAAKLEEYYSDPA